MIFPNQNFIDEDKIDDNILRAGACESVELSGEQARRLLMQAKKSFIMERKLIKAVEQRDILIKRRKYYAIPIEDANWELEAVK